MSSTMSQRDAELRHQVSPFLITLHDDYHELINLLSEVRIQVQSKSVSINVPFIQQVFHPSFFRVKRVSLKIQ